MLKKETLKQAIDAIAARDPEIGYSLSELFAAGHIDVEDGGGPGDGSELAYYTFNRQRVPVRNMDLFLEGPAHLEQSLLIRYGEMFRKQALSSSGDPGAYAGADESIRSAGLMHLLQYEIRRAVDRLENDPAFPGKVTAPRASPKPVLERLLDQMDHDGPKEKLPGSPDDPGVLFAGAVNADTPAFFAPFPYTRTALIQVADLGLSFFSVRFVIGRLIDGTARNLFACIVDGALAGLVYLKLTRRLMHEGVEIRYIASARGARMPGSPPHRGVGTFLVAGVWLLWKNRMPRVREILLNAEIKALGFYEEIGFEKQRPYVYGLKRPAGYLLNALAVMVDRSRSIQPHVVEEIVGWIRAHVRRLWHCSPGDPRRVRSLAFIKLCLLSRSQPRLARTAAKHLLRYRSRIPEAEGLLRWASRHGRIQLVDAAASRAEPLLVFRSASLQRHLQGIFHLDTPGRLRAIDEVLGDASLSGRWTEVNPRTATPEELAWVHTVRHIREVAATAGNSLHGFDLDTQATGGSYASACRAVGGVFSLLDGILSTSSRRGFAAVRPPGHHAEPDRAMGFCLFNNTALGASYLKHVWGLERVMIVDIDAHHGNGTQAAFYSSNDLLFISMHQFPCYPGTGDFRETGQGPGEGFSVNVPLNKGMGDREFLQVIDRLVEPLACAFLPEMILVSCGFDLYRRDCLAQLGGTPEGYAMITCLLCRIADMVCGGRIAFIMEGGYSIQGIRRCSLRIFQEMCGIRSFDRDRLEKILSGMQPPFSTLRKTIEIHKKYWSVLNR